MSMKLRYANQYGLNADRQSVNADDLTGATLIAGNEVTVFSARVPADKRYFWGYGPLNGEFAKAYVKGDLVEDGAQDDISGDVIIAITDSTQDDVIARRNFTTCDELREQVAEARSDRDVLAEQAPAASQDKYLEIRIKADASSDGDTLDTANSSLTFWYGEANV